MALAREMHDLVAHSVTLMVVQAGAARSVAASDPDVARSSVRTVQDTCDQAAEELRQLLDVLESAGVAEPSPTSRDVADLVRQAQLAGLDVAFERTGDHPVPSGGGVELSAYRIVQEALTNARKHAPGSRVRVVLRCDDGTLGVRVENDAARAASDVEMLGGGRGLIGMAERVTVFGVRFEAGPEPTGGFVVDATLPVPQAASS